MAHKPLHPLKAKEARRNALIIVPMACLAVLLVIIPFWTSALVRIYGWKILLQGNGPINTVLKSLGLIEKNIKFLGSYGSVLLAMVYCLISMMILPCHSSVDKMDFTLVEAARDLGSRPWRALVDVTLPLTMPGILAGCVLVYFHYRSLPATA